MWLSYNDTFEVSDKGQVRNKKTGHIKQPTENDDGYLVVSFNSRVKRVHRLVAERFLPAPTNDIRTLVVDHLDRDRTNNDVSNLRWCSRSDNNQNKGVRSDNLLGQQNIDLFRGRYRVKIVRYSTIVFEKTYDTLKEAIEARNRTTSPQVNKD
jgi:hypothetical protein